MTKLLPGVTLIILPQFKPLIADIIIHWSDLDDKIDCLRSAFVAQPVCASVPPAKAGKFIRRLSHLEALTTAYFAQEPKVVRFLSQTFNNIRTIQGERDLITHGRYGFDGNGPEPLLSLWDAPEGPDRARKYSVAKMQELLLSLQGSLAVLRIMYSAQPPELELRYWKAWGFRPDAAARVQTLLGPIRDQCLQAIRLRYPRPQPEEPREDKGL